MTFANNISDRGYTQLSGAGVHFLVSFFRSAPFASDRIRSFLEYLQELSGPVRFSGFPSNLYMASESLVKHGGTLGRSLRLEPANAGPQSINIEMGRDESDFT